MGQTTTVMRQLRKCLLRREADGMTDGQLLECFLARGEEAAFEALVHRHGPMVQGVCRRVLRNTHDAEDAFQATFLVLARKGAQVRPRDRVGPWLHGVAYRTATKARALASRRKAREGRVCERPRLATTEPVPPDVLALLDQELSRPPEKYRLPIVLCDLAGQTRGHAARRLGLPEGTLSSRLARGRDLLRRRLCRRGVALALGLDVLFPQQAPAVPAPLASSTVEAAIPFAAGKALTGVVRQRVPALVEGVLRSMILTRFRLVAVVFLAVGAAGLALGGLAHRALADKPTEARPAEGKGDKDKESGPSLAGVVSAVDADKGALSLRVQEDPARKETTEKKFDLARDAKVLLEHGLLKETKEGKLADLTPGTPVTVRLSVDRKTVVAVQVRGGTVHGGVKSVDGARNTLTVVVKGEGGPEEKTIELVKDAKVILDDGTARKNDPPKEGKLADLTEGTPVVLQLSGYDRKLAVSVRASGPTLTCTVKGYDAGNNTLTVTLKEDGAVVERTFPVAKDVKVDGGKLGDLAAGTQVAVRLSVADRKTVVGIHVLGQ
jgi:RNA polymerase sigma factor (sigma-70 family)